MNTSPPTMPPRRKKWTEEEERTLIEKYGELLTNGTLSKMKTREKKFRPIAAQVNSLHHFLDPISYPWQWSWKDTSTKVQNMRHQYLLVKQKIKKGENAEGDDQFDWAEGLTHWPNFLRYKSVFGDVALVGLNDNNFVSGRDVISFETVPEDGFAVGIDVLGLGLGFEYDGEEEENNIHGHVIHNGNGNGNGNSNGSGNQHVQENGDDGIECEDVFRICSGSRKKKKRLKGLANQLAQLRERESRFEEREFERERERQRREQERRQKLDEREKEGEDREKRRRERRREWEVMEKESVERDRRRKEEEIMMEREWETRMEQRRLNWSKRMNDMLSQHRIAMDQVQSRILHDQQSLSNQLVGILSQWTGHPTGLSDQTVTGNPYLSQMMHGLHHVNEIVHSENRVDEDNQDDQFIVDDE